MGNNLSEQSMVGKVKRTDIEQVNTREGQGMTEDIIRYSGFDGMAGKIRTGKATKKQGRRRTKNQDAGKKIQNTTRDDHRKE